MQMMPFRGVGRGAVPMVRRNSIEFSDMQQGKDPGASGHLNHPMYIRNPATQNGMRSSHLARAYSQDRGYHQQTVSSHEASSLQKRNQSFYR
ncbi:hypothetical protein Ciccas_003794 [Cichlidogyrus casuarinus]|uniref:Uncharacterized protein n=1 Tax=Cichlidogyrus casuarinus TaxID=1844966 RepID=A0ABD2QDC6_9PLAT